MKKIIIGNFKMNMDVKDTEKYLDLFLPNVAKATNEVVIVPTFTNLMFAKQKLTSTKVKLGAQNVSCEPSGAFTGEVSASMLKSVGADYVIVGHSERRKLFLEKNEMINKKIKEALSQGLKVILCVGETKYERQNKKYKQSLQKMVQEGLKGLYENELKNITIAYEPVWAIGSGVTPTVKQIEECASIIKETVLAEYSEKSAKSVGVVYGGSVNLLNAKMFASCKNIAGLLVGGVSLKADEFAKMCNLKFN